ncbi:hypothetical protein C2G38_2227648 [Gigaspora rosea]|uniref:Uncharacterized protein n=1 Tax=Gigaspora rosea TaxID=44941 RepID=A0A397TX61_9GLOM|nr:hypothetical protein C2G38_2227648 [Gigaspora rosea]CAG8461591.1 7083_t:CDS:1 [Gigaspora rosea]
MSKDKRKKEWIWTMVFPTNKKIISKIVKKMEKEVVLEHWVLLRNWLQNNEKVTKCKGCEIRNHKEDLSNESCLHKTKKRKILSTLLNLTSKEDGKRNLEISLVNYSFQPEDVALQVNESPLRDLTRIEYLEIKLIRKEKLDLVVENKLIKRLEKNLSYIEEELVFYTDGSCKVELEVGTQELGIG